MLNIGCMFLASETVPQFCQCTELGDGEKHELLSGG